MARTVLLADDSVTAQNMGRRILMDAGYEVVTVNNGSAALKKIHESKPDLIVLDVYMPGYGGLEVCQRLKESGETMKIPVLLTVGKMEPFKADEAKRVRADGHIIKPFEASELLAALTRLEDRIVPEAESADGRRGKAEKKTRFWHAEDPVAALAEAPTDRVAYLSEVKNRQSHNDALTEPTEATVSQESSRAAAVRTPAHNPNPAVASSAATAEFAVQGSDTPSQSAAHDEPSPTELQAAEPVTESPKSAEASEVEAEASQEAAPTVPAEPATLAEPPAVPIASSPVSATRWVAENVALTAEEACLALDAEMQQAQAVAAVAATGSETPPRAQRMKSEESTGAPSLCLPVVETRGGDHQPSREAEAPTPTAVLAAAASAAVSGQQSAVSPQPVAVVGDTTSVPEAEPPVPSEATAAWENWQQIRDSVMSPQKTAAIAESVAEIAQATAAPQEPTSKKDIAPSDGVSAAPAEDDNSINDIVDSVLADLKPRLMQEIAKKLAAKK